MHVHVSRFKIKKKLFTPVEVHRNVQCCICEFVFVPFQCSSDFRVLMTFNDCHLPAAGVRACIGSIIVMQCADGSQMQVSVHNTNWLFEPCTIHAITLEPLRCFLLYSTLTCMYFRCPPHFCVLVRLTVRHNSVCEFVSLCVTVLRVSAFRCVSQFCILSVSRCVPQFCV